jgi:WD40 repeat protein
MGQACFKDSDDSKSKRRDRYAAEDGDGQPGGADEKGPTASATTRAHPRTSPRQAGTDVITGRSGLPVSRSYASNRALFEEDNGATALATGPLVDIGGQQYPSCFVGSEEGGRIRHVNAATGDVIAKWDNVHARDVNKLLYQPATGMLFSASRDKTVKMIRVHEPAAMKRPLDEAAISACDEDAPQEGGGWAVEPEHPAPSSSAPSVAAPVPIASPEPVTFNGHTLNVTCVAASRDGRHMASGSRDNTMRLWDVATQRCLSVCDVKLNVIHCCHWLPEMSAVAQGGEDLTLRLWDVRAPAAMRLEHTMTNFDYHPICCDLVPDGTGVRLVTGHNGFNNTGSMITEWDLRMRRPLQYLMGHTNTVRYLTCCGDGDTLFSVSDDGTAREWRLSRGFDEDAADAAHNRDACVMKADFPEGRATAIAPLPLVPSAARTQRVDYAVAFRTGAVAFCRHEEHGEGGSRQMVRTRHLGFEA